MGAANALAAFGTWSAELPATSFKVLVYMALKSLDNDEKPWFALGHAHLAEYALGRAAPATKSDIRAVERAMSPLLESGAVTVDRRGAARREGPSTARYRLHLNTRRKTSGEAVDNSGDTRRKTSDVSTRDPQHPTISGQTPDGKCRSHPTKTVGLRSKRSTEEKTSPLTPREDPPAPPIPASKRGEDENLQKAEQILNRTSHGLTPADRNRVHTAIVNALNTGHPETVIVDALTKPTAGLNQPGAGLVARLASLGNPPPPPAPGSMTRDQAKQQPPCRHGIAGGWCLNASCGQPWCPQCRRDVADGMPIGPASPEQPKTSQATEAEHGDDFRRLLNSAAASIGADREPSRTVRRFPPGQGVCVDCAELGELREATTPDGSYCAEHELAGALR